MRNSQEPAPTPKAPARMPMSTVLLGVFASISFALLALSIVLFVGNMNSKSEIKELEQQTIKLSEEVSVLTDEKVDLDAELKRLNSELESQDYSNDPEYIAQLDEHISMLESRLETVSEDYDSLSWEYDELYDEYWTYKNYVGEFCPNGIAVIVTDVFNGNETSDQLDTESNLTTDKMQYLNFSYKVIRSDFDLNVIGDMIQIAIIMPDGTTSKGINSPEKYTFEKEITYNHIDGTRTTGWGNTEGTTYTQKGMYCIKFYYKDKEVGSRTVVIK